MTTPSKKRKATDLLFGSPKKSKVEKSVESKAVTTVREPEDRRDLRKVFYFLKEDVLERVRKIAGEKGFLYFCHRLQSEFNFNDKDEFWIQLNTEKGRKLVHFNRSESCRSVYLASYTFRYEEIIAAKKDGTLRSIGAINQMTA